MFLDLGSSFIFHENYFLSWNTWKGEKLFILGGMLYSDVFASGDPDLLRERGFDGDEEVELTFQEHRQGAGIWH